MKKKSFLEKAAMLVITGVISSLSCEGCFCDEGGVLFKKNNTVPIHKSQVAGGFYPQDRETLRAELARLLEQVPSQKIEGNPAILVSPHAGYIYSAQVAAYGYKQLVGQKFDTIIIIGPSHYNNFKGVALYQEGIFETPLGGVEIDKDLANQLLKTNPLINFRPEVFLKEHSIEVQIPFLQYVMDNKFKILPILIGDPSSCKILAEALSPLITGKNVLLIASSDMSHYHSAEEAWKIDEPTLDEIESLDIETLIKRINEYGQKGDCVLCGAGPVLTVMMIAKEWGIPRAHLLKYAHSGDIPDGDKSRVVGYSSFIITKEVSEMLNEAEQDKLLEIARGTLEGYICTKKKGTYIVEEGPLTKPQGVFVTLTKGKQLRGCIGYIRPIAPLNEAIVQMTIAASTQDMRFPPVRVDELKNIKIEISVLSDLKRITDISEIKVGTDGIYIVNGIYSGLLLPQVATEYRWNREEFLEHTCIKAGLPVDAWKEGNTQIYIFSAQIFHEK